jgi:DNA-directed RNA polymerase subunit RPC12/RpoP
MGNTIRCPLCGSSDTETYRTACYRLPVKAKTDGKPVNLIALPSETNIKPLVTVLLIIWFPMAIALIPQLINNPILWQITPSMIFILWSIPIVLAGAVLYAYYSAKGRPREVEDWMQRYVCWNCGNGFYSDDQTAADPGGSSLRLDWPHTTQRDDKTRKYVYEHTYTKRGYEDSVWLPWLLIAIAMIILGCLYNFEFIALIAIFPLSFSFYKHARGMKKLRARVALNSLFFPYPTLFLRYYNSRTVGNKQEILWSTLKIPLFEIAGVERIFFSDFLSKNFPGLNIMDDIQYSPRLKDSRYRLFFNRYVHPNFFVRSIQAEESKYYSYILFCDCETPHEASEGVEILLFDGSRVVFETDDAKNCVRVLLEYSHINATKQ